MRYKWFHLIPATLIFVCGACFSSANGVDSSAYSSGENTEYSSENFLSSSLLEEISETTSEREIFLRKYWNTEEVDISEIDPAHKLIAFTFDDAPRRNLENILAVFAAFNEKNPDYYASATVFCNGVLFDAQTPSLLHTALALDFELGNHTHSHADLTKLPTEEILREIDKTDALLQKIDGQPRHLLRAPFGRLNAEVKPLASAPWIDWTIDTLDWTGVSADRIYNSVFENKFSGAIVLMHDGYEHTMSALKRLLPDLKAEGYQVVSVSKMAKAHGCRLKNGSVYIRARKGS